MGKASVSNIKVSLGFAVVPKALAMARWSVVASLLAILPPLPSQFRPLAPYCPLSWHLTAKNSFPGWHPTAPPLRLAPYCYSPAGILLLLTGWHPTATHRLAPDCLSSLAGIPSARWLRLPTCLSLSCDLLYGRKPRLGYG